MKALLKNIQGVRQLILICTITIITVLTVYWVVLFISGDNKIAVTGAVTGAVAVAFAAAFAGVFAFAFAAAAAAAGAYAVIGVGTLAFAFAVTAAAAGAIIIAYEFKIKKWKVFSIYFGETVVLCSSLLMPQIMFFTLIALAVLASGLLIESGLCLRLSKNPPSPFSAEKVEESNRPFRSEK